MPWQEAGDKNGVANGSVMRCAPVGLIFAFDFDKLEQVSRETSAITHAHEDAMFHCVAVNGLIACFVRGGREMREILQDRILEVSPLKSTPDPSSGLAIDTAFLAVKSFIEAATFEEAAVKAVNLGGDTDTIGAVTGALAGAYWGASAIPERWHSKLNPYPASKIIELADALFDLAIYLR